jgi:archaellum component FlaC
MTTVSDQQLFEMMQTVQNDFSKFERSLSEVRSEMNGIRGTLHSIGGDIVNIYAKLARHDEQLDRIETRLELRTSVE